MGVKQPGREADNSPTSSAKVKECVELFLQHTFMAWCSVKKKQRDNFTFIFTFTFTFTFTILA
jgi:hypothetical protein